MKTNTNKLGHARGFTLIELLVVIAIIGILASVVLASLNAARDKGSDASAQGSMSSIRAAAEIEFDDAGASYDDVCTDADVVALLAAAGAQTNTAGVCIDAAGSYGAQIQLRNADFFCVDSTGFAGRVGASTIQAGDTVCN